MQQLSHIHLSANNLNNCSQHDQHEGIHNDYASWREKNNEGRGCQTKNFGAKGVASRSILVSNGPQRVNILSQPLLQNGLCTSLKAKSIIKCILFFLFALLIFMTILTGQNNQSLNFQQVNTTTRKLQDKDLEKKTTQQKIPRPDAQNISKVSDFPSQSKQQRSSDSLDDASIEWPKENELYHIYPIEDPRFVLDAAIAKDGSHQLILYNWNGGKNQMYYFKKVKDHFYHIISALNGEYMTKSEKVVNSPKIVFSKQQPSKLWQLVPAKPNANANNYFHILAEGYQPQLALTFDDYYAHSQTSISQREFRKSTRSQVWILRKNISAMDDNEKNPQKFAEKFSQLLYNLMHVPEGFNQAIDLEEMKRQMAVKKIALPQWQKKPAYKKPSGYYFPPQMIWKDFIEQMNAKNSKNEAQGLSSPTQKQIDQDQIKVQGFDKESKTNFKPPVVTVECAKKHKVAYVWYGGKEIPKEYRYMLEKCKENVVLLTEVEFQKYTILWNDLSPKHKIIRDKIPFFNRVDMLKLLYLYFQSGMYADFDTQINQQCFDNVYTNQMIFTNRVQDRWDLSAYLPVYEILVPEENFMMIRNKRSPQVKRMIQQILMQAYGLGGNRWRECQYRQCLIVQCQRHYRDNTYAKGYDGSKN